MGIASRIKNKVVEKTEQASRSAADFVAEALKTEGIPCLFTIPGVHSLDLVDACATRGPRPVLVTHEASASFMADAVARATGNMGAFFVVPGPGMTNAMTGIATSLLDQVPVLCIAAGLPGREGRRFLMHEIRQAEAFSPVVKAYLTVHNVLDLGPRLAEALKEARQPPCGPVVLEIAPEVLRGPSPREPYDPRRARPDFDVLPGPEAERAARMLLDAPKVLLYAGQGAMPAAGPLLEIAELLGAPVATTISGRGVIPEDHPLSVGFGWGPGGTDEAGRAFGLADLVFAVGARGSEMATVGFSMPQARRLIHLDADPAALHANLPAELSLRADSLNALQQILALLKTRLQTQRPGLRADIKSRPASVTHRGTATRGIPPSETYRVLRSLLPRDAILIADTGNHMLWSLESFPVYSPRTYLAPVDYQAMGYAVPASVAVSLVHRSRKVVAAVGDACLLMSGFELLTAAREKVGPVVVVFADRSLGIIKETQKKAFARTVCVDLEPPDYASLARALKVRHAAARTASELGPALAEALEGRGPALVEVDTVYDTPSRFARASLASQTEALDLASKLRIGARLAGRFIKGA